MDIVTQTVLGAAVGEATLGKKAGNKAILWGAVGGIFPDLDVLITPFFSDVDGLFVHRGFSHSLIFAFLLAPILGWLIYNIHKNKYSIKPREWINLIFWAAFTHPILDYFTNYGTGAFLPFSDYRVEFGTIGIVDVFYTIPFILTLLIIPFIKKTSLIRRRIILTTVIATSLYLIGTVGNKFYINSVFKETFGEQGIDYKEYKTVPLPLTNFLWMGTAKVDSGYYMALYSNFDNKIPEDLMFLPKNEDKISDISDNEDLKNLIKFTKGFYHINEDDKGLYLADVRFGMMGIDEDADFIFKFYLKNEKGEVDITQYEGGRTLKEGAFSTFIGRINGI